jgi:hypothetical protein
MTPGGLLRVRHRDGERLRARDLDADAAYETLMLARHVRALHATWGIALGFEVSLFPSGQALLVGPGLAYDCTGQAIVSSRAVTVPLPAAAGTRWFDLVARRAASLEGPGRCGAPAADDPSIGEERPDFRLVNAGGPVGPKGEPPPPGKGIRPGLDVPLARVKVPLAAGDLPDLSPRRYAQPLARPHVAAGFVAGGNLGISGMPLEWMATIDTTSGGFSAEPPAYFAALAADPTGPDSSFAPLLQPTPLAQRRRLLGPFVSIQAPTRTGFTLRVRLAALTLNELNALPVGWRTFVSALPVGVSWVGVESNSGRDGAGDPAWFPKGGGFA